MGSLRNPVGPLPSSIYWRRRAVLLTTLGLLALLIIWVVISGGGNGNNNANGSNDKNPTASITPGPSDSGSEPPISEAPGGRDESSEGGDSSGSDAGSGGGDAGGSDSGSASGGTGGAGGTDDGEGGGAAPGEQVPAGSSLPNCTAGTVTLSLRSMSNEYEPGENPTLELIANNASGTFDCKVDLGPKTAVVTITQSGNDDDFWSSADCPSGSGSLLFRVPAGERITYTIEWDRKPSAPECATPPAGEAPAGTYLVEAESTGFTKAQASFVLAKD
ncbi:hypothetical protein [Streptomyces sp. NPDC002845]